MDQVPPPAFVEPSLAGDWPNRPVANSGTSTYLFISNRGWPIDRRTLLVMMKKYGTAAGIPAEKQQFHALKHSIGTHILDAGEDVYFAKDWLGY